MGGLNQNKLASPRLFKEIIKRANEAHQATIGSIVGDSYVWKKFNIDLKNLENRKTLEQEFFFILTFLPEDSNEWVTFIPALLEEFVNESSERNKFELAAFELFCAALKLDKCAEEALNFPEDTRILDVVLELMGEMYLGFDRVFVPRPKGPVMELNWNATDKLYFTHLKNLNKLVHKLSGGYNRFSED